MLPSTSFCCDRSACNEKSFKSFKQGEDEPPLSSEDHPGCRMALLRPTKPLSSGQTRTVGYSVRGMIWSTYFPHSFLWLKWERWARKQQDGRKETDRKPELESRRAMMWPKQLQWLWGWSREEEFMGCLESKIYPACWGFPCSSVGKESACNVGNLGSIPGLGRSPGEGNGNPLQYPCLEKSHGQRSLVGCSPWGLKESGTTERLTLTYTINC